MATRRRFSKELKQEAVQMTNVAGVTITQIANELGISPRLLGVWRKQLATSGTKAFPGRGKPHDEEMAALKRELARGLRLVLTHLAHQLNRAVSLERHPPASQLVKA